MKLHHFALFFFVIASGFIVTAQIVLTVRMQRESTDRIEYDCLVAAINATVEEVFTSSGNIVTEVELARAEEVFFQTLAVVRDGATDPASWKAVREYIPCLVVFDETGCYRYYFEAGKGYHWTAQIPYEEGQVPEHFFEETERILQQYHNTRYDSDKVYRMERAERGIWEQSIVPPCIFAIYAPQSIAVSDDSLGFLYAATGRTYEAFYVTEDRYCHLPFCKECKEKKIVARYATQRESAEDGASPCELCLK